MFTIIGFGCQDSIEGKESYFRAIVNIVVVVLLHSRSGIVILEGIGLKKRIYDISQRVHEL
jgi:hypothetical protein